MGAGEREGEREGKRGGADGFGGRTAKATEVNPSENSVGSEEK